MREPGHHEASPQVGEELLIFLWAPGDLPKQSAISLSITVVPQVNEQCVCCQTDKRHDLFMDLTSVK